MAIMAANEIKESLMKIDKDIVCGCLASILYQLTERGIKFNGYEEKPNTIKIVADDKIEIVPGLPNDPLEYRAKLDFSDVGSKGSLIHYFQCEINICKERLDSLCGSMFFNGVDCKNFKVAKELNKAHIKFCEGIIDGIKRGQI